TVVRPCIWIVVRGAGLGKPAREMGVVARDEAHARGGNVDAMCRIRVVVGKPAAKHLTWLDDGDRRSRSEMCEMIGDGRAGEAAADDGDVDRLRLVHRYRVLLRRRHAAVRGAVRASVVSSA